MTINRKYDLNHHYFASISTREKAYWLGWLWSDGYLRNDNNSYQIVLSLHKHDECVLQQFKSALSAGYPIRLDREAVTLCLTSSQMFSDLQRYGVIPRKSVLATYPNIEREFVADFVRGVFDGDGCIHATHNLAVSIVGTEPFCRWLQETVRQEIDIHSAVYHKKNTTFRWWVHPRESLEKLARWMYRPNEDGSLPVCLERKYAKFVGASLIEGELYPCNNTVA